MHQYDPRNSQFLFFVGLVGIVFYAVGPIFLPHAPIRDPELLPVYVSMMGIGRLLKPKKSDKVDKDDEDSE